MLNKYLSGKTNFTKNGFFSLSRASPHHSFTFNSRFLYALKHKVHISKTECEILNFRSIPPCSYKSLYSCSTKSIDSLTLKHHNSFQNLNNRKATHRLAPRPLLFKQQLVVWKFNDVCVRMAYYITRPSMFY